MTQIEKRVQPVMSFFSAAQKQMNQLEQGWTVSGWNQIQCSQ